MSLNQWIKFIFRLIVHTNGFHLGLIFFIDDDEEKLSQAETNLYGESSWVKLSLRFKLLGAYYSLSMFRKFEILAIVGTDK